MSDKQKGWIALVAIVLAVVGVWWWSSVPSVKCYEYVDGNLITTTRQSAHECRINGGIPK